MCELIFLDIDGCLTDGKIIYSANGVEMKEFNVKDGAAIEAWLKLGKKAAIITGRQSECVNLRARDLKIDLVYQGIKDKLACAQTILKKLNLSLAQCAAIGDYYNDTELLNAVKFAFTPKDAFIDVGKRLKFNGGKGAVAQMIEILVQKNKMQKEWARLWR